MKVKYESQMVLVFPVREGVLRGVSTTGEIREAPTCGRYSWSPLALLGSFFWEDSFKPRERCRRG